MPLYFLRPKYPENGKNDLSLNILKVNSFKTKPTSSLVICINKENGKQFSVSTQLKKSMLCIKNSIIIKN